MFNSKRVVTFKFQMLLLNACKRNHTHLLRVTFFSKMDIAHVHVFLTICKDFGHRMCFTCLKIRGFSFIRRMKNESVHFKKERGTIMVM